jgi:sugar transferase (PEP-CTERM/EpsH1 system associated)
MNILFLCHRIPYPPDKGEKIRAFHILRHLAARHTVHLAAFVDDPADRVHAEALRVHVNGEMLLLPLSPVVAKLRMGLALASGTPLTTSYFASVVLDRWIGDVLKRHAIDRAVLFSSAMAPFLLRRRDFDPAKVVLDMVDVDSDKWRQYATTVRPPLKWIYAREAETLLRLERRAACSFGATLLVSPFEVQSFERYVPEARGRVRSVANGVALPPPVATASPYRDSELPLVMVGTMDYWPNVEGALWFADQVLPLVRKALPQVRFYIVGAKPAAALLTPREGVTVTGKVDDVRPYVAHAAAVVAPLRLARGVQNKVLEGLAHQKPVVASRAASRGLDAVPGRDLWMAEEPDAFAEAVIAAATGPDRERMAANGRALVEREYDWTVTLGALDRILESSRAPAPVVASWQGRLAGASE